MAVSGLKMTGLHWAEPIGLHCCLLLEKPNFDLKGLKAFFGCWVEREGSRTVAVTLHSVGGRMV